MAEQTEAVKTEQRRGTVIIEADRQYVKNNNCDLHTVVEAVTRYDEETPMILVTLGYVFGGEQTSKFKTKAAASAFASMLKETAATIEACIDRHPTMHEGMLL